MQKLLLYLTRGLPPGPTSPGRGTVFMPLPIHLNLDGHHLETQVRVTNASPVRRAFSYSFVPDATGRRPDRRRIRKATRAVPPHATVLLGDVVKGRPGILEIDAGPQFAITSQLIGISARGRRQVGPVMPLVATRATPEPTRGRA